MFTEGVTSTKGVWLGVHDGVKAGCEEALEAQFALIKHQIDRACFQDTEETPDRKIIREMLHENLREMIPRAKAVLDGYIADALPECRSVGGRDFVRKEEAE